MSSVPILHENVLFIAASIMGPPEQYVHQGSTVTLTCIVPAPYTHGTRPPRVVDWFHSDRLVSIQVQLQYMETVTQTYFLHTGLLISPQPDQEGTKLQRQKIFMLVYPIYNNNWRNISIIYIYITRLTSKEIFSPSNKVHREVGPAKDLSAPQQKL